VNAFDDTIAAIATPLGEGGLAVIRISGAQALAVGDKSFLPTGKNSLKPSAATSHTIHYGKVVRAGKRVDEVLCAVMRAPRTYTREDVVEITCHGGILSAKTVLDTILENGARLAEPGEFTKRAFLNGRLDLTQAEAVMDLIQSRTELALTTANDQLAGKLSQRINQLRDDLMSTRAHIEAYLDFPDEDIPPATREQLEGSLERGIAFMDELLRTANEGQILRRGIRAAIVGRPNAGKSSLLNQLLGHNRAIVSAIPGTTRDTIEETANIRGLPVVFIDTAGLRAAQDALEEEGIRRSHESLARAEFILHVLDASEPLTGADEKYLAEFGGKKRIFVRNKVDLPVKWGAQELEHRSSGRRDSSLSPREERAGSEPERGVAGQMPPLPGPLFPYGEKREKQTPSNGEDNPQRADIGLGTPIVDVCCVSGQGIEALKDAIKALVWSGEIKSEMLQVMINSRHQDALRRAREATVLTLEALRANLTLDLVAVDLHIAVNAVG
jgi:tRNA modification GTPase